MVTLTHPFVSGKADGTDVTLVKPTNWNAEHKFETAADGVLLGRAAGAGPGVVQELPTMSVFPPAMIMPYAGGSAPAGWLLCQGQLLVRADYMALSNVIGGTYNIGGETAAQFRLPDLRGRVIAGVDAGAGRIGNIIGAALGGVGGAERIQYYADISGSCSVSVSVSVSVGGRSGGQSQNVTGLMFGGSGYAASDHFHDTTSTGGGSGSGSGSISGGGYTRLDSNAQPTLVLHYLIKT